MCAVDIDFGLGLRPEHYEEIAANPGQVSWFEALSENYMVPGGSPMRWLDRLRRFTLGVARARTGQVARHDGEPYPPHEHGDPDSQDW